MIRPLTSILISLIIAIIMTYYFPIGNLFLYLFLCPFFLVFSISIRKRSSNDILIVVIFFLLGAILTNRMGRSSLDVLRGQGHPYIGIIHERLEYSPDYSRYVVKLNSGENSQLKGRIVLSIRGDRSFQIGDKVYVYGILKEPSKNTNPMLYNQKLYLLSNNIHNTMSVNDYSVNLISENTSFYYKLIHNFSQITSSTFNKYLSERNTNLMTGIILGRSNLLGEEDIIRYRHLGLAHVLAVSGLHIGIIAEFLVFIFSRLGIKRRWNIVLTLGIIWTYTILIGLPPSALRAGLMFTILYISHLSHEPYDGLNSIFLSMIISLFINPYYVFNLGFQLSYAATISLLLLGPRINIYPFKSNLLKTINSILAVNIGLLPIQAYYFNLIPLLGIISNLLTVAFFSIALILAMLMMVFELVLPFINLGLGTALDILLNIQYKIVDLIYSMENIYLNTYSPGILEIGLYYLLVLTVFRIIDFKMWPFKVKKTIFYYLLGVLLISAIDLNLKDSIEIHFIDVGQGDSILIKSQNRNFLMDTGGSLMNSFDIGKNITLPYLKKEGLFKLDGVIITHFDADHSQGLNAIMEEIKIDRVLASYLPEEDQLKLIKDKGIPLYLLKEGDYIPLDNKAYLEIVWPPGKGEEGSPNNKSLVSILNYKKYKILLTGDMEKEVELVLKDRLNMVHIFKVPHHGSSTSSCQELLDIIRPQYSIISVGRNNLYSHPNDEVLERLEAIDSSIYRTDEDGMIRVRMDDRINIGRFLRDKKGTYLFLDEVAYATIFILYFLILYILVKIYYSYWRKTHELQGF